MSAPGVVVVVCTEISSSNEQSTDLDGIISSCASDTVNILHLWRKHGINLSYPRRQEAPCRFGALLGSRQGGGEGF